LTYPDNLFILIQTPRRPDRMNIGLFLSKVDGSVSSTIDLNYLASQFSGLSVVKIFENLLSTTPHIKIPEEIKKHKLDGIVLAGHSPLFYKKVRNADRIFDILQKAGINANKIAVVNLKEQIALPHRSAPQEATQKAKVLIEVALEKIRMSKEVEHVGVTPKKHILIIGSTPSGLFAGQRLAERGYNIVYLNESLKELEGSEKELLRPTLAYLRNSRNVRFIESSIKDLYGYPGNFRILLADGDKIRAGAIIVSIPKNSAYTEKLYPFLRLDRDEEGYFRNLISETATVETAQAGIFMIPHTEGRSLSTMISLADSANTIVNKLLGHGDIQHELFVSEVDKEVCGGCGTCIKTCIFHAAEIDQVTKLSSTNFKRCVGCGNCVSACPTGARDQVSATTKYLISAIKILSSYNAAEGPKVLFIACEGCGYPSLDFAGESGIEYPANLLPLSVRCAGRIDTQLILEAFKYGFDGVAICKCHDNHCLNIVGNLDLDRRANLFRSVLRSRGIESERLRIFGTTECEGGFCVNNAVSFVEYLKGLGGMY
jgi:F420-non-reducing hydrogenase iron-sulfur subunit